MTQESCSALRQRLGHSRQYGYELSQIKPNHVVRYRWAAKFVGGLDVIDAGCGIGYGSTILAKNAKSVVGLEFDEGVVEFARKNWSRPNVTFQSCELMTEWVPSDVEACVAFESIEHLIMPELFLSQLPLGCLLFGSTPNETTRPLKRHQNPHHFQHYTDEQIQDLLNITGFEPVTEWWSHDFGELSRDKDHRTLVFRSKKMVETAIDRVALKKQLVRKLTMAILERNNRIRDGQP